MLKKIERLIMNGTITDVLEINDAVEAYNIMRFIDSDLTLSDWEDDFMSKYRKVKKILAHNVGKFFSGIDNNNFMENIKSLELEYREDFFSLFDKFGLQDRIDWSILKEVLEQKVIYISHLLRNERIVKKYEAGIRHELLSDPENAELILDNLAADLSDVSNQYIFPRTISSENVHNLFLSYIESPHPNINYLRNIKNYRNGSSSYSISRELQYNAKLRIADLEKEIFYSERNGIETSIEISFQKIDTIKKDETKGLKIRLIYNSDWITEHNSHIEILRNFVYLFEYMNQSFQINLFSKPNEGSIIERALSSNLKSDYDTNYTFTIKNMVADLQILAYSKKLRDQKVEIENTLEWYYREYLHEKYGIESFQISLLKNYKDYYEMCKSIVPEIEAVAKQYLVLVEKGQIDHQYISAVNPTINYQDMPSTVKQKYAYSGSIGISNILFLLFSTQSSLTYISKYVDAEKNFASMILNKRPLINDIEKYQIAKIDYLIDQNIIEVNETSRELSFVNIHKVILLRTLFDYGFLSVGHYPVKYKEIIDAMISSGDLVTEEKLLSKQEASYFNYYLNSSEFGNSKDLRNKYVHGSSGERGEKNELDYYSLLKILVLLTLKIDNDLYLSDN